MNKYKIPKETTEHIAGMQVVDSQESMGGGNGDSLTGMVRVTPADGELYVSGTSGNRQLLLITDKPVYDYLALGEGIEAGFVFSQLLVTIKPFISDDSLKSYLSKVSCSCIVGSMSPEYKLLSIVNRNIPDYNLDDYVSTTDPDAFDLWLPALDIDRILALMS